MTSRRLARTLIAVLALAFPLIAMPAHAAADATATFTKTSDWGSGFGGKYTITNGTSSTIDGWEVAFDLPAGHSIGAFWNAAMTRSGQHYIFSDVGWNSSIAPGATVSFGFNGSPGGETAVPSNCTLNGADCGGGDTDPPGPDAPGVPGSPQWTSTDSTITLTWTAPDGPVTGYRVYENDAVVADVTATTVTFDGLPKCDVHRYQVAAYNEAGEGEKTTPFVANTTGCVDPDPGDLPKHFLTGYWHNFVNPATELKLSAVPDEYDLVAVAFAEATSTAGEVTFAVDPGLSTALGGYTDEEFKADVRGLHARGKKVIISVGGEKGRVSVASSAAATRFANSVYGLMQEYGFDGVDIDLENGLNATYMSQALRSLHGMAGDDLIITMAPQTIDMQNTGRNYFQLALNIKDILTVVNMQYYNSGSMLGCDQMWAYSQGTINFLTALACIQLENGLRPDQVALGLPAGPGAAGGGVVAPSMVNDALDCLATQTNCGSFAPPRTYPGIRGAMTWSINWDASHNWNFSRTVKPHLATLP